MSTTDVWFVFLGKKLILFDFGWKKYQILPTWKPAMLALLDEVGEDFLSISSLSECIFCCGFFQETIVVIEKEASILIVTACQHSWQIDVFLKMEAQTDELNMTSSRGKTRLVARKNNITFSVLREIS